MESARAFIHAGGEARWEFLAFRHNEDQVEAARSLSESMGFTQFSVEKSARFLEPSYDYVPGWEDQYGLTQFPIYDTKGKVVGKLEPPGSQNGERHKIGGDDLTSC